MKNKQCKNKINGGKFKTEQDAKEWVNANREGIGKTNCFRSEIKLKKSRLTGKKHYNARLSYD